MITILSIIAIILILGIFINQFFVYAFNQCLNLLEDKNSVLHQFFISPEEVELTKKHIRWPAAIPYEPIQSVEDVYITFLVHQSEIDYLRRFARKKPIDRREYFNYKMKIILTETPKDVDLFDFYKNSDRMLELLKQYRKENL